MVCALGLGSEPGFQHKRLVGAKASRSSLALLCMYCTVAPLQMLESPVDNAKLEMLLLPVDALEQAYLHVACPRVKL